MTNKLLRQMSDEELEKIANQEESSNDGSPDYSRQSERGVTDYARDIGYGLAKGGKDIVESLPNMLSGGVNDKFLEAMGKKQDINIEGIKSPNPSPWGDLLQKGAEFAVPLGGAGKVAGKGLGVISKALKELPLTEKMASKGLERWKTATQELPLSGEHMTPELTERISQLFSHPAAEAARPTAESLIMKAQQGGTNPAFDLQSLMGKVGGQLLRSAEPSERIAGDIFHMNRRHLLKSLEENMMKHGYKEQSKALAKEQGKFKKYKDIEKNIYQPLKDKLPIAGYLAAISKLLGR